MRQVTELFRELGNILPKGAERVSKNQLHSRQCLSHKGFGVLKVLPDPFHGHPPRPFD
jgi:hypothetical protein